jgi:hypothetical protein
MGNCGTAVIELRLKAGMEEAARLSSLIKLTMSLMFPALGVSVPVVVERYARIADRVETLCTLAAPLQTSRIAAALR